MELKELRAQWEKGGDVMLCVFEEAYDNKVIYVVVRFSHTYTLFRYWKLGDSWNVSADVRNVSLETCLNIVSKDFANGIKKEM